MRRVSLVLILAQCALGEDVLLQTNRAAINAFPVLDGFVSYSIEFSSFPDFAGNLSHPNTFSNNLLNNLGYLQGTKPYIRVGGNTQDFALYNASLDVGLFGIFDPSKSEDYPTTIQIGPSYFESYQTWPLVKFSHGFNLAKGANGTAGWETLLQTVPLACQALGKDRLYWWEYGNEPDLFPASSVRPPDWNETTYVQEFLNGTRTIRSILETQCPELTSNDTYGYLAPSFAGTNNKLKAPVAWAAGLNTDQNIRYFSSHNYISGATSLGVTLQDTLMNHTRTMQSVNVHVTEYRNITANSTAVPPHIFGETNSLFRQGRPGLSNTFGATLWGVDFNLYSASVNINRVHMHMGTDYRYGSWQPIATNKTSIGTKAPYYGNIAVAAFLGNLRVQNVAVAHIQLDEEREAAYAAYADGALRRIMVINLQSYNYTINGTGGPELNPAKRSAKNYSFQVDPTTVPDGSEVLVQRLHANGSDAITGITWDGWSYNYELDEGRPVKLGNVTTGEKIVVNGSRVAVSVLDSQAAILTLPY